MNEPETPSSHITKDARHRAMTAYIKTVGVVGSAELAQEFSVTLETVRTDILSMSAAGLIERVRGGARWPQPVEVDPPDVATVAPLDLMASRRANQHTELKRSIGLKASHELPSGNKGLVILDAGSSTSQLATCFPTDRNITVMTNSVEIATELSRVERLTVVVPAGTVRAASLSIIGPTTALEFSRIRADVAFISTDSASTKHGLLCADIAEAALKHQMAESADKVVALLDHSKFAGNSELRHVALAWDEIDVVVTDSSAPIDLRERLELLEIRVEYAEPRRVVGVDIGGDGIRAAVIDTHTGTLVGSRVRLPTPNPSTVESVVDVVKSLVAELNWAGPVGIAMPGLIRDGTVTTKHYLDNSWFNTNAEEAFSNALERQVRVINDGDAAGLAETQYGTLAGLKGTAIMLVIGTGIGSFKVRDGTPVLHTELGHTKLTGGPAHMLTSRGKVDELGLDKWAEHFNELLLTIAEEEEPGTIVIGGGVSKNYESIKDKLKEPPGVKLQLAKARNHAEVIGAAYWRSKKDG